MRRWMSLWFMSSSSTGGEVEEDKGSFHEADPTSGGKDGENRREAMSLVPGWTGRVAGAVDAAVERSGGYLREVQHAHDASGF